MPDNGRPTGGSGEVTFEDQLEELGFVFQGRTRRGGAMWALRFNRYLEFTVHDYQDSLVVTWACALGEFLHDRGMQIGAGETDSQELYPQADARVPVDLRAVEDEIRRVLARLRFDLADPSL